MAKTSNLATLAASPWAVTPAHFEHVLAVYRRHLAGEVADLAGIEAAIGKPLDNKPRALEMHPGGVAVISLEGVICKRMNMLSQISGGVSTQIVGQQFQQAIDDPNVSAIVLAIDSPGGTVDGTAALAAQILAARGTKPVLAYCDGLMASAAYWIGCAADRVFIADHSAQAGAIGVIASHVDQSARDSQRGLAYTLVTSGPRKGEPNPHAPLNDQGRAALQESVDHAHGLFRTAVASARGLSGPALDAVTDGRMFHGQQTIDAGLVDGIAQFEIVIAKAAGAAAVSPSAVSVPAPAADAPPSVGDRIRAAQTQQRRMRELGLGRTLPLSYFLTD